MAKEWVLKAINRKWRDLKSDLKGKYYDKSKTREQIMENVPEGVRSDHWCVLVNRWFDPEVQVSQHSIYIMTHFELCRHVKSKLNILWMQAISEKNAANASANPNAHTCGRKSFARRKREIVIQLLLFRKFMFAS